MLQKNIIQAVYLYMIYYKEYQIYEKSKLRVYYMENV